MKTTKNITITKRYFWRDLEGGVLHEPKEVGPYYNCASINGYDGHETEEEAMRCLAEVVKEHGDAGERGRLVLICEVKYASA